MFSTDAILASEFSELSLRNFSSAYLNQEFLNFYLLVRTTNSSVGSGDRHSVIARFAAYSPELGPTLAVSEVATATRHITRASHFHKRAGAYGIALGFN